MDDIKSVRSYRDLRGWKESLELAADLYGLSRMFPKEEPYGLTSQIRRSAASVPANIAEGYGRESKGAYMQSLRVAQGSFNEPETHLLLAGKVELTAGSDLEPMLARCDTVGRMLHGLIRSLDDS